MEMFDYLTSFNFRGRVLTMIEAAPGATFEAVRDFAVAEHLSRAGRECKLVWLAGVLDIPESWKANPIKFGDHEVWLLGVVWVQWDGMVFGEVCDEK